MHFRRKKSLKKTIICLLLGLFVFILLFYKIDRDIKPVLLAISSTKAKIMATETINKVVKDELSNNVKYTDFINIKTGQDGKISAVELNTVEMNKFGANVALKVQEEMKFSGGRGVSVPLGLVTGSNILSYLGPDINVRIMPLGNVVTDFKSEFEAAGINQTRYRVYITVNTELEIIVPLGGSRMNVSSTIPVAEALIVGEVPSSYFNTNSGGTNIPNVVPIPSPDSK